MTKIHYVIRKGHDHQSWLWKRLHQARMMTCKHKFSPMKMDKFSYITGTHFSQCEYCEAILETREN